MSESTETTESASKSKTETLVEITIDGSTRSVYPEVAKFHATREAFQQAYAREVRLLARRKQEWVWEQEDAFYSDPANKGRTFEDHTAGRQWDRDNGESTRAGRGRHSDFLEVSSFCPEDRQNPSNPNSWAILREEAAAAGHKEVVWIIDNCLDNASEALILIQHLPSTSERLWEIAKDDHGMCEVFDRYMLQAEAQGLFDGRDSSAGGKELRALHSYVRRTYGSHYARDLNTHISRLMKALREDAARQVADAKAEWQQMDAARAENASRERAEREEREALAAKAIVEDDDQRAPEPATVLSPPSVRATIPAA